jgi:hypothetical protein
MDIAEAIMWGGASSTARKLSHGFGKEQVEQGGDRPSTSE